MDLGFEEECCGRVLLPWRKRSFFASAHSCAGVTIYNHPPFLLLAVLRLRKIIKRGSILLFHVRLSFPFSVASYDEINAIFLLPVELFRFGVNQRREFALFSSVFSFSRDDFQPGFSSFPPRKPDRLKLRRAARDSWNIHQCDHSALCNAREMVNIFSVIFIFSTSARNVKIVFIFYDKLRTLQKEIYKSMHFICTHYNMLA